MKKIVLIITSVIFISILGSCGNSSPVLMTYRDSKITSNMYSYWLSTYKSNFLNYYNDSMDEDSFWENEIKNGLTTEQYATELINKNIKYILIGMQLFREYNLKISPDITAAINDDIKEKIEYYGSRSELNTALSAYGINTDILKDIYIAQEKLNAVYDYLYGENGIEKITEEMLDAYYAKNYSRIKYLIIYTKEKEKVDEKGDVMYDSEGYIMTEPLSDEERREKENKISEAMICVNAGDNFESIMEDYNEEDMSQYPNGFYVSANELGIYGFKMIDAVQNMKIGEVLRVDDEYATYIIKKYEPIDRDKLLEADLKQLENLEKYCIQEQYELKFSQYADDVVVNEEELSKFSVRTAEPNSLF